MMYGDIELQIESEEIKATTRKLTQEWTCVITPLEIGKSLKIGDKFCVPHGFSDSEIEYVVASLNGDNGEAHSSHSVAFIYRENEVWCVRSIWMKSALESLEQHFKI